MRLARYRPVFPETAWTQPFEVQNRIQKLLHEFLTPVTGEGLGWIPQVDVVESDAELVLRVDLPGMTREDVELDVMDGVLVLKGVRTQEKEEKKVEYRMVERMYGTFERSFALPSTVDAEKIRATFQNGVLEVYLPKTAKAVGRRVMITG